MVRAAGRMSTQIVGHADTRPFQYPSAVCWASLGRASDPSLGPERSPVVDCVGLPWCCTRHRVSKGGHLPTYDTVDDSGTYRCEITLVP